MSKNTIIRLESSKIAQNVEDVLNLSGTTNFLGRLSIEEDGILQIKKNAGAGKVLTSNETGILSLENVLSVLDNSYQPLVHDGTAMVVDLLDGVNWYAEFPNYVSDRILFLNPINGVVGDIKLIISETTTITIYPISGYDINFIDGSYLFDEYNTIELDIGIYHIGFAIGDDWIDINIAGYNGEFEAYVNTTDFTSHINDTNKHLTQLAQTITGVKTFIDIPELPNTDPISPNQVTHKRYVDGQYNSLFYNNKIKTELLPESILGAVRYMGTWIPKTNEPELDPPSSGNTGHYYVVTHNGTYDNIDYLIGDWIISNGKEWSKVDNTDNVITVNGQDGVVELYGDDILLEEHGKTIKFHIDEIYSDKSDTGHTHALTGTTITGILPVSKGGTGLSSGTANRIPYWSGSNAISSSDNLTFSNGRLVLKSTSNLVDAGVDVINSSVYNANSYTNYSSNNSPSGLRVGIINSGEGQIYHRNNFGLRFGTNNTSRLHIDAEGKISIGSTTNLSQESDSMLALHNYGAGTAYKSVFVDISSQNSDALRIGVRNVYGEEKTFQMFTTGKHHIDFGVNTTSDNVSYTDAVDGSHNSRLLRLHKDKYVELGGSEYPKVNLSNNITPIPEITDSNHITTKKYVDDKVRGSWVSKNGAQTLVLSDGGNLLRCYNAGDITIPTHANVAFPVGTSIYLLNDYDGIKNIVGQTGVTIHGNIRILERYKIVKLVKRTTTTWYVVGNEQPKADFVAKSGAVTLILTDAYKYLYCSGAGDITVPLNSSVDFEIGTIINICNEYDGIKNIVGAIGVTLRGDTRMMEQYKWVQLVQRTINTWYVIGGY